MIISNVPYFANTLDDTHCFQAVLKMVLKYFLPDKEYTFAQLDKLSGKVPNMWTWSYRAFINLHQIGFELIDMGLFDNARFSNDGEQYLVSFLGKEVAYQQKIHSDLLKEVRNAREYVNIFGNQHCLPEIDDIKKFIDKGFLVGCNVNSQKLNGKEGYCGHSILAYGYDDSFIYLHDPGSPPLPNRKVSYELFTQAWGYPDHQNQNLTAFKLK